MTARCDSCKHFFAGDLPQGWCVIGRPVVQFLVVPIFNEKTQQLEPVVRDFSGWPRVDAHQTCGEHVQGILISH